jgi:cell division protein FtsX
MPGGLSLQGDLSVRDGTSPWIPRHGGGRDKAPKGAKLMTADVGAVKIDRQISLPLSQAMKIAQRNITIRLGRAAITAAGTMLGIAFLMSVFTSALVLHAKGLDPDAAQQQKNTWLVAMSLLVSVVGITNSMLMSVTERYKEIGTMKCLGALDNFIVKLFLLESGMLGFFGSLVGALLGALAMLLTGLGVLGSLDWKSLLVHLVFCVAIGTFLSIIAAVAPALKASHMQAADAMRSEV